MSILNLFCKILCINRDGGYGLGLSICKRKIILSKDEIDLNSKCGKYILRLLTVPY